MAQVAGASSANPSAAGTRSEPTYYYPPPGSRVPPLTAREVCQNLHSGLTGRDLAQDLCDRGFQGTMSHDEANEACAAGASAVLVAALQAGRFTVSPSYLQRQRAELSGLARRSDARSSLAPAADNGGSKLRNRSRSAAATVMQNPLFATTSFSEQQSNDIEQVLSDAQLRQQTQAAERQLLAKLATENERASAARAQEDARRDEGRKKRADRAARQRDASSANSSGSWSRGHRYGSR